MDHKKFPPSLKTKASKMRKARTLIEEHLRVQTTKAQPADLQGMYSETIIVSLKDGTKHVVQFRDEPLDIGPFQHARQMMGDLVPTVEILRDEELEAADLWPVYMNYIPGESWAASRKETDAEFNVAVMRSLAKALTKCHLNEISADVVQQHVTAKLERLLASSREEIDPFRAAIGDLLARTQELEELPLFLSHLDLNQMNIMVLQDGTVSGIVDWELSPPPIPFGMGLNRIHDLAGQYRNGIHYERKEYEDMERCFWEEIVEGAPDGVRTRLKSNLNAIQTSTTIGIVLNILDLDHGGKFNMVTVRALPKLLTYRIPALRGNDPPYADPPYPCDSSEEPPM